MVGFKLKFPITCYKTKWTHISMMTKRIFENTIIPVDSFLSEEIAKRPGQKSENTVFYISDT